MTFKTTLLAASAGVVALTGVAFAAAHMEGTIANLASKTESLSTLYTAVGAADLATTLEGEGPFTVFAPTNDAFAALPDGTVETLLEPANKDQLAGILTYHVVPASVMAADVVGMIESDGGEHVVETVNGATFTVSLDGDNVIITDAAGNTATVVETDIEATNGVIHVIDGVLMPM